MKKRLKINHEYRYKFIWGVKSEDCLSDEANLFSLNDIDIVYDNVDELYKLSIETIYKFQRKTDEVKYLENLLEKFTEFMKAAGLNIDKTYEIKNFPMLSMVAGSIPELYTNFKIFVNGYKILYGGNENE